MGQSIAQIPGRALQVLLHPWQAMVEFGKEADGASLKFPILFVIVMGVISGIITAIVGMFLPLPPGAESRAIVWASVLLVPILSLLGSFLGAAIVWILVDGLLKSSAAEYKASYRIVAPLAAFSPVSAILSGIPVELGGGFTLGQILALAINIWATVVLIGGVIIVRQTPKVRTIVTCAIIFLLMITAGLMARIAAEQQLNAGAGFDLPAAGAEDDVELSEELQQQLDELTEKAKTQEN